MRKAGLFVKDYKNDSTKICYLHPYLAETIGIDPFDENKSNLLWGLDINNVPLNSLIIWDSHFAPNEGKLQLNTIKENIFYTPIKHYKYFDSNLPFEIWVFERKNRDFDYEIQTEIIDFDNSIRIENAKESLFFNLEKTTDNFEFFIDDVSNKKCERIGILDSTEVYSGKYSVKIDKTYQFALTYQLINVKVGDRIKASVWRKGKGVLVFDSVDSDSLYISNNKIEDINTNGWDHISIDIEIKNEWKGNILNIYVWNQNLIYPTYFDDFKIERNF